MKPLKQFKGGFPRRRRGEKIPGWVSAPKARRKESRVELEKFQGGLGKHPGWNWKNPSVELNFNTGIFTNPPWNVFAAPCGNPPWIFLQPRKFCNPEMFTPKVFSRKCQSPQKYFISEKMSITPEVFSLEFLTPDFFPGNFRGSFGHEFFNPGSLL